MTEFLEGLRKYFNQFFLSCSFHGVIFDRENLLYKFFLYVIDFSHIFAFMKVYNVGKGM